MREAVGLGGADQGVQRGVEDRPRASSLLGSCAASPACPAAQGQVEAWDNLG